MSTPHTRKSSENIINYVNIIFNSSLPAVPSAVNIINNRKWEVWRLQLFGLESEVSIYIEIGRHFVLFSVDYIRMFLLYLWHVIIGQYNDLGNLTAVPSAVKLINDRKWEVGRLRPPSGRPETLWPLHYSLPFTSCRGEFSKIKLCHLDKSSSFAGIFQPN